MDVLQSSVVTAIFVAANTGLILTQRSLLLIDAYKFPFPLVATFLGLFATLILCLTLSLLLKILSLGLTLSQGRPSAACSVTYIDDACPERSRRSSSESANLLSDTDSQPDTKPLPERSLTDSDRKRSPSGRSSTWLSRACCGVSPSRSIFSSQVCFGLALAFRLSIGTVFLSHVSFYTYTTFALASLPLNIAFNYCGESASSLVLGLSEVLLLLLVVVPKATFTVGIFELFGIALPIADSVLAVTGWKAFRLPWHENLEQHSFLDSWMWRRSLLHLIRPALDGLSRISSTLSQATVAALVIMLPLLKLSGEVGDMINNCYVSGQSQFVLRVCAMAALHFAVLLGFALASTIYTPIFVASALATLYAVLVAVVYHNSLTAMDWINLALCWTLMLIRLLRGETVITLNPKGHRNFWRAFRKVFLGIVIYVAILRGSITLQEYIETGSIAMLPTHGGKVSPDTSLSSEPFNSTLNLQGQKDNYLGDRPEPAALVNWGHLMTNCADSVDGLAVEDIANCLHYLAVYQEDYLNTTTPNSKLASQVAKQLRLPQGQLSVSDPKSKCDGPSYIYHTYWTGKATWRVELFIKGFLYSQNLACSRLWIWLDADANPDALNQMLYYDSRFQRYQGLLDQGYIELKAWRFPEKIPIKNPETALEQTQSTKSDQTDARTPEGLSRDAAGNLYITLDPLYKIVSTPTQISDLVRFVVLHLHGGVYLDMDVLLLRDLRPFLLPDPNSDHPDQQPAWAEQWVEQITNPGDYNTAVLSLPANSSITSYLLQGGKRMGMNYHPRVLGLMLWKDGRREELAMLHNAVFDPLVTNLRRKNTKICTVPCHKNFEASFMENVEEPENEWSNYHGNGTLKIGSGLEDGEDDQFPPSRSMDKFFRGAFAYHVHNQWQKFPEPSSWMDVITATQDGFFAGQRTNAYGEMWEGPHVDSYDRSEWRKKRK